MSTTYYKELSETLLKSLEQQTKQTQRAEAKLRKVVAWCSKHPEADLWKILTDTEEG